jgi:tetratricopeptide (TPR) repeat protein
MRFLLIVSLCLGSVAYGDDRTDAQKHYVKGTKAFDLGAYDEAIAEYNAAYRIKADPALLYNLGQAHRLANHTAEAIHFYRMYLTKIPNAPNRDEVVSKLDELQRLVEQQRTDEKQRLEEQQRSEAAQKAADEARARQTPETPSSSAGFTTPAQPVDNKSGRTTMIAGAAVTGVGVAALAGGIVCGVLAKQNSDALTQAGQKMQAFDSSKQSAGKTEQAAEIALLAVGGAAVVTGVVLVLVGRARTHRSARAQIAPTVGPHTAGATMTVQF